MDSSASIGEENFHLSKEFAKKLCRRFAIAEDKVHVSITSYSMHVTTLPSFTDSYNEKSIESDVDKHVYEASSTATGRALRVVIGKFNEQRGGTRAKDPGKRGIFQWYGIIVLKYSSSPSCSRSKSSASGQCCLKAISWEILRKY